MRAENSLSKNVSGSHSDTGALTAPYACPPVLLRVHQAYWTIQLLLQGLDLVYSIHLLSIVSFTLPGAK